MYCTYFILKWSIKTIHCMSTAIYCKYLIIRCFMNTNILRVILYCINAKLKCSIKMIHCMSTAIYCKYLIIRCYMNTNILSVVLYCINAKLKWSIKTIHCMSTAIYCRYLIITLLMLRLLSFIAQGHKDLWKPSKPSHVGIYWIALMEYSHLCTHLPGFQSFFRVFAWFRIDQISHQQHKG